MTTKRKTLAEAAIDVLQSSAKENQEPIHKGPLGAPQPANDVHDLGGATTQDPRGNSDYGSRAAAAAPRATPPGHTPPVGPEGREHIEGKNNGAEQPHIVEPAQTAGTTTGTVAAPKPPGSEEVTQTTGSDPVVTTDKDEKGGKEFHEELTAEEIAAAASARREMVINKIKTMSVDEDFAAMFAGNDTLSEEFKNKAKTIFEAAVVARAVTVVEELEKELVKASEEAVGEIKEELEGKISAYLDHMVSEWMETNKVAIESGLRNEITEEFVTDLRGLFVKHNINIPEEQVPVVEELTKKVNELTAKLNESLNTSVELSKKLNESKKSDIIESVCNGLTATQKEKVKTLAEGVEFTTDSEYQGKLKIIREQYFPATVNAVKPATAAPKSVVLVEGADPVETTTVETSPAMDSYVRALSKQKA